nr:RecName: Full=Unknown protein from spot 11 of 2D-PAGE of heart tissue [Canis lupus familiaris]
AEAAAAPAPAAAPA